MLAVSFVRSAADLEPVADRVRAARRRHPADREDREAAGRRDEAPRRSCEAAAAGIMVARGDLGHRAADRDRSRHCRSACSALAGRNSKPAITATQMLASMVTSPRPTRAEVTDVANAIYDGTDAVMLSEETAVGEPPDRGCARHGPDRARDRAEPALRGLAAAPRRETTCSDIASSVAQGAVGADLPPGPGGDRRADPSGRTARLVSAHRPSVPVLAISPSDRDGAAAQPPVRRAARRSPSSGRAYATCSTSAPTCAQARGRRQVRRADRDHRRAPRAGARDEPLRGSPGSLGATAG